MEVSAERDETRVVSLRAAVFVSLNTAADEEVHTPLGFTRPCRPATEGLKI